MRTQFGVITGINECAGTLQPCLSIGQLKLIPIRTILSGAIQGLCHQTRALHTPFHSPWYNIASFAVATFLLTYLARSHSHNITKGEDIFGMLPLSGSATQPRLACLLRLLLPLMHA